MTPDQTLISVESTSSNKSYQLQHAQAVLGVHLHCLSGFLRLPAVKGTTSQYLACRLLPGTLKEQMGKTAVTTMQEDDSYFKYSPKKQNSYLISQQSRSSHPELLQKKKKKKKSSKSLGNPCHGKASYGNTQEGRGGEMVAGTLLFIVQYFTESTKASSVFTRIAL